MLSKWIKSALLPRALPTLSTRHLRRYGAERGAWRSKKSPANTSTSRSTPPSSTTPSAAHTDPVGRQQLHVGNRLPARQSIGRYSFWTSSRQAGHPYHATDRLLLKSGKTSDSQRPNLFYCSITEGANISSIFTRRGVSPCSNEYCAVVSSTLRLAAIPWRMSGVASALRASGGSKPVSR